MLQSNSPRSRSPGPARLVDLHLTKKAGARLTLMKRPPPGTASPDPTPRGASSLIGAWALKRAPGRSSAACAWLQLWAAGNGRLPFSLFCGRLPFSTTSSGADAVLSSSRSSRLPRSRFPCAMCGVQPSTKKLDRGGSRSLGGWGRVCGPREAFWLTILRHGTFWTPAH